MLVGDVSTTGIVVLLLCAVALGRHCNVPQLPCRYCLQEAETFRTSEPPVAFSNLQRVIGGGPTIPLLGCVATPYTIRVLL